MRWLYPARNDHEENSLRDRVMKKIDSWWSAFFAQSPIIRDVFRKRVQMDLPKWMQDNLQCIHAALCWEFGPGIENKTGDRLVITPESHHNLRPLVQTILARAPMLPEWEFLAFRPPESLDMTIQTVRVRTRGDISDARVTVRRGHHNRIDLVYHHPRCGTERKQARHDAFVATETLLGEEILDHWIGVIDAEPMPVSSGLGKLLGKRNSLPGISLDQLKPTVDALTASAHDQLPRVPVWQWATDRNEKGEPILSLLRMDREPPEQDDYPRWSDLMFETVYSVELATSILSGTPIYSPRYSRIGETFCYLKMDHTRQQLPVVDFRCGIEDPLKQEIEFAKVGSHFGGGSGRKYAYVFLALTDTPRAIELVRQVLRAHLAPKRSWLLFFDAELADEWIGIWDDTPAPPA